ncbi:3-ketodihydrosphingosine reductase-like [Portunus trituberculatus]|uniref:3-ketodihydrosphingosine reductase-like n=1 Tax=Portunus trituberculatus TaxID=210409 RepID=UPI001E1CCA5F|nr:3-ketodihydrosphingosine reductase-like [Portunus trituberculatus]
MFGVVLSAVVCGLVPYLVIRALWCHFNPKRQHLQGKHVLVTGGSSGIGLSVARQVALLGAKVTLVARNVERLQKAKEEVESVCAKLKGDGSSSSNRVQVFSVDLAGRRENIATAIKEAEASQGPVYMLVNCAGFARAQVFEDIPQSLVKELIDVNLMGSFTVTQEVVRGMKQRAEGGAVVFTSSQGGLVGLYGFTAYSAAKAAVVKLAEALHMELKPHGITVTVCYPPDTQTPGFEEENKTKPVETRLISEAAGLFTPEQVAKKLVDDALQGNFSSTVGFEGFMLTTLCAGMGPITDSLSLLSQVFLTGLFRLISAFYLWSFSNLIRREHEKKIAAASRTKAE